MSERHALFPHCLFKIPVDVSGSELLMSLVRLCCAEIPSSVINPSLLSSVNYRTPPTYVIEKMKCKSGLQSKSGTSSLVRECCSFIN